MTQKEWADEWFAKRDSRIDEWIFRDFLDKLIDIHQLNDLLARYGCFESHEQMWEEYEIEMFLILQGVRTETKNRSESEI